MYIAALEVLIAMSIYLLRTFQVQGLNKPILTALQWDKVLIEISAKYSDYAEVFFLELAIGLLENTGIIEYTIELIDSK